jgi:hypothetical protein
MLKWNITSVTHPRMLITEHVSDFHTQKDRIHEFKT